MSQSPQRCPIAIVGMACRYPDADDVGELLANSLAQRRSFRQIPAVRLAPAYFDPSGVAPDRAYAQQAALLRGFHFDRAGFHVSRASYEATDMSHWLALTVAREAIADIRFLDGVKGPGNDAVRVVVGNTLTGEFARAHQLRLRWPYVRGVLEGVLRDGLPAHDAGALAQLVRSMESRYKAPFPVPDENFLAGGLSNTIAGRICNHFDFHGGGYTVDGACASSLLAVSDACSALAAGDADLALAGGVDLSLDPFELVGFSRSAALAHGEMLVYDEQSAGFWPGEGCGFVALMRYDDALAQCARIHAVIRGWGVSSDGHGGLTRPEADGQLLALRRCYARAGYGIESVGYFEGHGTGTKVGDETELRALATARGTGKPVTPAVISSVKANIGHTKAAAGLAGLLRATMCVREHLLPPTTGCRRPHRLLAQRAGGLRALERLRVWDGDAGARRAGVSAMGFGGINTHLTIEEAPADAARTLVPVFAEADLARFDKFQDAELFLFCAHNRADLAWTLEHLSGAAAQCSAAELTDLAAELARRANRGALSHWRGAIVAATPSALLRGLRRLGAALDDATEGDVVLLPEDGVFLSGRAGAGRIGLLFSGQGSPARGAGGAAARRFDAVARIYGDAGLDPTGDPRDTAFAQPAIAAASLAGLAMLAHVGVRADIAVGHSLGELSALHWAGSYDAATLMDLARARGRLVAADRATDGAMAAVAAGGEQLRPALAAGVHIANLNGPEQTVLSGAEAALRQTVERLRAAGTAATLLPVRHAFHTPLMAGAARAYGAHLERTVFAPVGRAVVSSMTARALAPGADLAGHLAAQLLAPVDFLGAARAVVARADLLIEVGPGMLLANLTNGYCPVPALALDVGADSLAPFLRAAAAAYVLGSAPDIANLFAGRHARRFDWSWNPAFLANPCETVAPVPPLAQPDAEPASAVGPAARETVPHRGDDLRQHLRAILAEQTGLPTWILQDGSRMLSDLHLNSITVGAMLARLTAARGIAAPADPTQYANASIDEIATGLAAQSAGAGADAGAAVPDGVAPWLRWFAVREVAAAPLAAAELAPGHWTLMGASTADGEALLRVLNGGRYGDGVLVWLAAAPGAADCEALLRAAQCCADGAKPRLVVVQHGWGGSGFARSFFLEHGDVATLVLNLDRVDAATPMALAREIGAAPTGFRELFLAADGARREPRMVPLTATGAAQAQALGADDVLLVTGGGKGIGAECGYQMALRQGCALLVVGRGAPTQEPELHANLARMHAAHIRVSYQQADVADPSAVAAALGRGVAALGRPVSALLHGAGTNAPCGVAGLSAAAIASTLAPKVAGLRNILAALDTSRLKLLVTFSSIIARIGLRGEADYALSNEWLSQETVAFQRRHPACLCRAIEWSVWSGVGMAQRLGSVDALLRQGIAPISVDQGIDQFLQLSQAPGLPVCVVVAGRFGNPDTLPAVAAPVRQRFLETVPVYYPGIELVADSRLSPATDPYLDDHVLGGERLLPAVMALEAMGQAAMALSDRARQAPRLCFRDVRFLKAIVVPDGAAPFVLRVAALADADGGIAVTLRCSTSGFKVNHVEARCSLSPDTAAATTPAHPAPGPALALDPRSALYGNVLFQTGRFRRIEHYHLIEARRCGANLAAGGDTNWFLPLPAPACLLGDPGMRDAALHAIQACIPHQVVIPVAVGRIDTGQLQSGRAYRLYASEVADHGRELVYDLTIMDADGNAVERWHGITLRLMGEPAGMRLNAPSLMAPFFERRAADAMPEAKLTVALKPEPSSRKGQLRAGRRADGKPDPVDGRFCSRAYSAGWELAVGSVLPVGCDIEAVPGYDEPTWTRMLGQADTALALAIGGMVGEPFALSAARVWTAREALKKAGAGAGAPVTLDATSSASWLLLVSGAARVYCSVIEAADDAAPLCVAVALIDSRQRSTDLSLEGAVGSS